MLPSLSLQFIVSLWRRWSIPLYMGHRLSYVYSRLFWWKSTKGGLANEEVYSYRFIHMLLFHIVIYDDGQWLREVKRCADGYCVKWRREVSSICDGRSVHQLRKPDRLSGDSIFSRNSLTRSLCCSQTSRQNRFSTCDGPVLHPYTFCTLQYLSLWCIADVYHAACIYFTSESYDRIQTITKLNPPRWLRIQNGYMLNVCILRSKKNWKLNMNLKLIILAWG